MKKSLLIISILFSFTTLFSQNIISAFEIIPDEHLIQIDPNRRKDLIDLKKSNKPAVTTNKLGGVSELEVLTDDYIKLKLSNNSYFELKQFHKGDDSILCIIKTVCASVCDSEITFYNSVWQKLNTDEYFQKPPIEMFVQDEYSNNDSILNIVRDQIDFTLLKLGFTEDDNNLNIEMDLKNTLPEENYKIISPFIKENPLQFTWKEGKFTKK